MSATVGLVGWGAAGVGKVIWSDSGNIITSADDVVTTRGATYLIADARSVDVPLAVTMASIAVKGFHLKLPEPAVPLAAFSAADAVPNAALPETRIQLASLPPSDPVKAYPNPAVQPVERPKDCLGVQTCIDEYLWSMYERTPKVDTNTVTEKIKVTVTKKGKTRTVTKTTTKFVVADFTWKDPAAAQRVGMPISDYVIGGMDRSFKLKLFHMLHAAEAAGLSPGITSGFRDDYRQSIASGLKAASNRSYHGGSLRGGYRHGLAADVVSVDGGTRDQRFASSVKLWKWVDSHGKEFGIGRPYLGMDPPHVAPVDGQEYAKHNRGAKQAASDVKKIDVKMVKGVATRDHSRPLKRPRTAAVSKLKAS